MVTDLLANASLYRGLSAKIARAFDFIATADFSSMTHGRHSIDGEAMQVILSRYQTQPAEACRWEAHRRYIDIQCMLTGIERMGVGNIARFAQQPYDAERDVIWMEGAGDFLTFREGAFMILWPQDAHMPGVCASEPAEVVKAVVKIAAD